MTIPPRHNKLASQIAEHEERDQEVPLVQASLVKTPMGYPTTKAKPQQP